MENPKTEIIKCKCGARVRKKSVDGWFGLFEYRFKKSELSHELGKLLSIPCHELENHRCQYHKGWEREN